MIKLTIDNIPVEVPAGTTILDAAKTVGVELPTLCYMKSINDIGACRMCVAEIEGHGKLVTTCNTPVLEGMAVITNSPRARQARMTNMQLILSQHNVSCPTCIQSTNCELQRAASALGVISMPFNKHIPHGKWDMSNALIKDDTKCIKCMRCIQVCKNIQALGVWGLDGTGARTVIGVADGRDFAQSDCALCGQCSVLCPTGALSVRDDTDKAFKALADPEKITVVCVSPAMIATWSDSHGLSESGWSAGRVVSALRKIGFDNICNTSFSDDLSIMEESGRFIRMFIDRRQGTVKEEGDEFIKTYTATRRSGFPLFTSSCPGVVRFIKARYPEMTDHLSPAKSPQQMFGVIAKTHIARTMGVDPSKIFCVSVMPCAAKKAERLLPGMDSAGCGPDVDLVLTLDELGRMIAAEHISPSGLPEGEFDALPDITGSGVSIGAAGGLMEASLRTVYYQMTGKFAERDAFSQVHIRNGWRDAFFDIAGTRVKVAVALGLDHVQKLIEAIIKGEAEYDYAELLACPGGCAGCVKKPGDGAVDESAYPESLYGIDRNSALGFALKSPSGSAIYEQLANSDAVQRIHHLLRADHDAWQMPGAR